MANDPFNFGQNWSDWTNSSSGKWLSDFFGGKFPDSNLNPGRYFTRKFPLALSMPAIQQIQWIGQNMPGYLGALTRGIEKSQPGNIEANLANYATARRGQATQMGQMGAPGMEGMGYGSGAQEGYQQGLQGQAERDIAGARQNFYSPQGQQQALQGQLGLYGMGMDPSFINSVMNMTSNANSGKTQDVGTKPGGFFGGMDMSSLGSLAGMFGGGPMGMMGGMGGGFNPNQYGSPIGPQNPFYNWGKNLANGGFYR